MAAPTIGFDQLPANENPYAILQGQFKQAGGAMTSDFSKRRNDLQRMTLTDQDYGNRSKQLDSEYESVRQDMRSKMKLAEGQLNSLRQMIDSGRISPEAGYEAMMRMVVPQETAAAMFPRGGGADKPLGIGTLMGRSLSMSIGEFAGAAEDLRGFEWGEPRKSKDSLTVQYLQWREQIGYDQLNPVQQNQLDMQWDIYMKGEAFENWWADKDKRSPVTEVKMLRAKGDLSKQMAGRVSGTPSMMRGLSTPMGKATTPRSTLSKVAGVISPIYGAYKGGQKLVEEFKEWKKDPTAEELRGKKTKEAYEQGKKLGYWD